MAGSWRVLGAAMSHQPKHLYEFGLFRLDAGERLLLREGESISLTPKSFDLLLALVEHHGHLLEKDELMKLIWPDTFVEEANLPYNISLIRKALGDGENGQKYIETVPRRGYRFVAGVREIGQESEGPGQERQPELPKAGESLLIRLRRYKRGAVISLAVLIVAAATVASFTWKSFRSQSGGAINSIAVLPFANADPNTEYLSDGITESLINSLSQLSQLKVIARTTAFRYKGKDADPRTVGQDLKIDTVLTGRVTQQGETLLVQVDLVNATDGAQLWGERYNQKLSNILTVQEEIARQISEKLRLRLTVEEQKRIAKRQTENIEAYQLYQKGRYYAEKRTIESYRKATEHYRQALDLDPNYARAWVGLADAYYMDLPPLPPKERMSRAKAAAMKALAIDETLGEAHTSLARVIWQYDWDWAAAEREFKRAIELDPGSAFAHRIYGYYLTSMGRLDESLLKLKQAQHLDPLSLIINLNVGQQLDYAGRTDEAMAQFRKTQAMDPNFRETYHRLGDGYCRMGKYAEAVAELERADALARGNARTISLLGYAYGLWGKRVEAVKRLDELKRLSKQNYVTPFETAVIYTGLGEKDQAFDWLQRACDEREPFLVYLKVEPIWDSYRADPRFADLLRCVGLPQ